MLIFIFFLLHTCSDYQMNNDSINLLHESSYRIYLNIFIDIHFVSSFLCLLIISTYMLLLQIEEINELNL